MKEKIKKIYLTLGIIFLILTIVIMLIWISRQINLSFFTFNQRKCISEYLSDKYEEVERMTYEEIENASQIWNLDKTELHKIRESFAQGWEEYRAEWDKCWEKYGNKSLGYIPLSKQPEEFQRCINGLTEPTSYTPFKTFIEGKTPILTNSLIKQLASEGICIRPSLLK